MNRINYHNRYFVSASNTVNGDVDAQTIFHYRQESDIVWATYEGGEVIFGTLIARVNQDDSLDMRYQHINKQGEIMTGRCFSTPEILPDNRIRLYEKWQWTSGDLSQGESIIEEVK